MTCPEISRNGVGMQVIIKVKAHTGKNDAVSVYNDMADKFANQGAEKML